MPRPWGSRPRGGGVAAVQIARLSGACALLAALGNDEPGNRISPGLEEKGVKVHAVSRPVPQRWAFVHLDSDGERTITTISERLGVGGDDDLPWQSLAEMDAVYFTAGDASALRAARQAQSIVATIRARQALSEAGVRIDVLVASANDPGEQYRRGDIEPIPNWVVRTNGALGGSLEAADGTLSHWSSIAAQGPKGDTYGAGDSFAAGLTCGLGMGMELQQAIHLGAFCGASAVHAVGPYGSQISAQDLPRWREIYSIKE